MDSLGIALLGCGTVGVGVARLLAEHPARLEARAGRRLALRKVVVREPGKARAVSLPGELYTRDLRPVLDDPQIQVAVELVGGVEWARRAVLDLLAAGKDVVTANKALLAEHGTEVFAAARRYGRTVAFEASVGGGVPIVAALAQGLAANQILSIQGILNGTSNFILTGMAEQGRSYAEALADAQAQGFAEADPTLDVDGTDAAYKLAVLARLAFDVAVPPASIDRRGIAGLHAMDVRFARGLGYTIKLLAEAWLMDGDVALHVSPVLLRQLAPLAQVRGPYNAVYVTGDAVGDTLYYGRGAGMMPTASAVVADLIDVAVGRAALTFRNLRLGLEGGSRPGLRRSAAVRSRFYLRLLIPDRPGVLAEVARVLAAHQISIASVVQPETPDEHEGDSVPLVVMTHAAPTGDFRSAVAEVDRLACVAAPAVYYPVGD